MDKYFAQPSYPCITDNIFCNHGASNDISHVYEDIALHPAHIWVDIENNHFPLSLSINLRSFHNNTRSMCCATSNLRNIKIFVSSSWSHTREKHMQGLGQDLSLSFYHTAMSVNTQGDVTQHRSLLYCKLGLTPTLAMAIQVIISFGFLIKVCIYI